MTALEQLEAYLSRLEMRFRLSAAARGSAAAAAAALLLTLLFVWIGNQFEFAEKVTLPLRIALYLGTAAVVVFGLLRPLLRLNRRWVARRAEESAPGFEQRLLTLSERPDRANPFTELLAEDALSIAQQHGPESMSPAAPLFTLAAAAIVAAGILLWIVFAGPGYWGYGASLLWTGLAEAGSRPLYDIQVQPGSKTIRRKTDQMITAQLRGFSARQVTLRARPSGAARWEQISMQADSNGAGYQFLFPSVTDSVEYYVEAGATRSKHFQLNVKDLPSVKRVRVAVHFPSGLGLRDVIDDPGGDVRAVEHSEAEIAVLFDRPLENGALQLDSGQSVPLVHGDGNWYSAKLAVEKDGSYHVAEKDHGEWIRISDDYFIEAKKDEPPVVKIARPGRDPKVSPIEEVPVTVEASDDFGLKSVDLHYSVNGGPEQVTTLLKSSGVKESTGKTTLYLENFKLVPGDLVSMYATAHDAQKTSRSDILFAQAEAFNYTFRQSQQGGGGGGGQAGNESNNISERQKQIIAATWNELKSGSKERGVAAEEARFLADVETKLGEQAKSLAERMGNRDLAGASPEFETFSRTMNQASDAMKAAVSQLKPGKWNDALPPEQKALQALLRAEATFREIQVAFGQRGGGGGGGDSASRDLERLFDLELDTDKNQYETGASQSASAGQQQKAMDEALQRLQMLAKRQQELAAQKRNQEQTFQQRWEEEQLRREAEDLKKQLEQLAQNGSGQQEQQQQQNSNQQGEGQPGDQQQSSSASGSKSGSRSASRGKPQPGQQSQQTAEAMRQTLRSLERAEDEMRKAVSQGDASARERAASELSKAQDSLQNTQQRQAGQSLSDLAERSRQIAQNQRDLAEQIRSLYGGRNGSPVESQNSAAGGQAGQMPSMTDPRYPYGFRRRYMQREPAGSLPASDQEKQLANKKEGLGQQLEQLQKQLQDQAQRLQGTEPDASSKLRKALSNAQSEELALRMQKNAEWMRQGYGARTWPMEDTVTKGVEQLSREVQDAQQALGSAKGKDGAQPGEETAKALADVRRLRQQLEARLSRSGPQQGSSQASSQDGQASAGGGQSSGQPRTSGGAPARQSGVGGSGEPTLTYGDVQSALQELSGVRQQLGPRDLDKTLSRDFTDTLGSLRNLGAAKPGEMEARLSREVLPGLERLEIELNRRAGDQTNMSPRLVAPEAVSEPYRDAVAEYFKRLSR